jgi:hypothetical protein
MVVEQHLAALGDAGERQHAVHRAPRDRAGAEQDARVIDGRDEGDLLATGRANFTPDRVPDRGREAIVQVFSSFFFAAGKRTLLRMSR